MTDKITVLHFSPCGTTRKVALIAAESVKADVYDLTLRVRQPLSLTAEDTVIVSVPVYMGRVPELAVKALREIHGNQATAIAMAVYGNRHYNDALVELYDILCEQGFRVVAGGAFVAQHSMVGTIGAGRPDDNDVAQIKAFAAAAFAKIQNDPDSGSLQLPGNRPYLELPKTTRPIAVSDACNACGLCAEKCPVGAIPADNVHETDLDRCIGCMRCIHICPQNARSIPAPVYEKLQAYMSQYAEPKANEWFVAQ